MTGVWEGTRQDENSEPVARLLSIPIGEGRMLATTQGLEVTANIPLLGMDGTFVARVDEVPLSDEPDAATVTVPTGKLEVNMEGAALDAALAGLGLPAAFEASGVEGNAGFRAYTPGFDRDSDDPLQRGGGVAFDANLDAAGFVDDARASVALELATGNFTATAAADQLGPFGGVTVTDAEFTIAKNTLTRIASERVGIEIAGEHLEGPTALMFAYDDVVAPAKALTDFVRSSRVLELKTGVMEGQALDVSQIDALASLPPREELQAKLVGLLAGPMTRLVGVLGGPSRSMAYLLNARAEQLGGGEAAEAAD